MRCGQQRVVEGAVSGGRKIFFGVIKLKLGGIDGA